MGHFWTHKDIIPEGYGYGQFSKKHFYWILISILLISGFVVFYCHSNLNVRIISLRIIGAVLIIIDVIKMFIIGFSKASLRENLPLEICSFAAYFIVVDCISVNNKIISQMLLLLFLPAALMAVIYPTSTVLPFCNFFTIHQFIYHDLIIAYILARFVSGEIPMSYIGVWQSIFRVLLLVAVMYIVDTLFNKNFMFLKDHYGNLMLKRIWDFTGGGIRYTIGLVGFAIFIIHIFFFIFKFIQIIFGI